MFFYNFFYSVPDLKPNERMHRIETGGRFDYNDVARPSLPRSSVLVGQCAPQCTMYPTEAEPQGVKKHRPL